MLTPLSRTLTYFETPVTTQLHYILPTPFFFNIPQPFLPRHDWDMLYAFGSNGSGQLGIGHEEDVSIPTLHIKSVGISNRILKVSAGGNHTLLLDLSGDIHITGALDQHIKNDKLKKQNESTILHRNVALCSATWEASVLYTCDDSCLLTCGKGAKGELGRGPAITEIALEHALPLDLPLPSGNESQVVDLASGMQHTVAVLLDGTVYGWGNGRKGQLGEPSEIVWYPRKLEGIDFKVVKAVCGREFTYLASDSSDGRHAILGSDKWSVRSQAPATIHGWKQIGACWASIFVLFPDGRVVSWGRNDHGQLAPLGLPTIVEMANGSEHSIAITQDGRALAWGWGEHGNCGPLTDSDGDVKAKANEVFVPGTNTAPISGCGAGCATTWLWV